MAEYLVITGALAYFLFVFQSPPSIAQRLVTAIGGFFRAFTYFMSLP